MTILRGFSGRVALRCGALAASISLALATLLGWGCLAGLGPQTGKAGAPEVARRAIPPAILGRNGPGWMPPPWKLVAAAFSPDGKRVAAVKDWGELILWEIPLAHQVWSRRTYERMTTVAFSADGKRLITGGSTGGVRLWNAANGKELHVLTAGKRKAAVAAVGFSPSDNRALAACAGAVYTWDAGSGKFLDSFDAGPWPVWSRAVFTSDGRFFLAAGPENSVRVWSTGDGSFVRVFVSPDGTFDNFALSPSERFVLVAFGHSSRAGGTLRLWEMASGCQVRSFDSSRGRFGLAVTPDHRHALTAENGLPELWNLAEARRTRQFTAAPMGDLRQLVVSPDGTQALLVGHLNLLLWDLVQDEEVSTLCWGSGYPEYFRSLAISPDGKQLVGAVPGETPRLWDARTTKPAGAMLKALPIGATLTLKAGGGEALVVDSEGTLSLWNLKVGKNIRTLARAREGTAYGSLALSLDGRLVAWAGDDPVQLRDASIGTVVRPLAPLKGVVPVQFLPDGKHLVGVGEAGKMAVWDVGTGRLLRSFQGSGETFRVVLAPQGHWAVLVGKQNELWNVGTGRRVRILGAHEAKPVDISPDGKLLLCSRGVDGGLQITRSVDGTVVRELPPRHIAEGRWAGFSPGGKLMWLQRTGVPFKFYDPISGRENRQRKEAKPRR